MGRVGGGGVVGGGVVGGRERIRLGRKTENHENVTCCGCIIGGNCHKYYFCCDKSRLLSRQKHACRDKTFVATNIILLRQPLLFVLCRRIFVATEK